MPDKPAKKATRKPRHPSVTADRVMEMCECRMTSLDNPGICFACGAEADVWSRMYAATHAKPAASIASMAARRRH